MIPAMIEVSQVEGRYPRGPALRSENIVVKVQEMDDGTFRVSLDDAEVPEFWLNFRVRIEKTLNGRNGQ